MLSQKDYCKSVVSICVRSALPEILHLACCIERFMENTLVILEEHAMKLFKEEECGIKSFEDHCIRKKYPENSSNKIKLSMCGVVW